jgi:hypothetical protein
VHRLHCNAAAGRAAKRTTRNFAFTGNVERPEFSGFGFGGVDDFLIRREADAVEADMAVGRFVDQ